MNKQELLTNGRCKKKADRETVWPVVIMNFTGVYAHEVFARNNQFIWLDCRHLSGTRGYCDKEGIRKLKRVIAGYPAEGIHFIDSGNYHYLTKLWTDKLRVPFSLIVFDHHPDMQPPLWELGKRHVRLEYALQESGDSRCIGQTDTHRTGRIRTTSQFL